MAAYVIVEVKINDPEVYAQYRPLVPATLEAYGGKFVVRGGGLQALEGGWAPERMVVMEFPSVEQAQKWCNSPEYAPAKALRQKSANTKMLVVEGVGA